jgi:hypothetical protein
MRVLQARNMGEYGSQYLGAVGAERAADLNQAAKINTPKIINMGINRSGVTKFIDLFFEPVRMGF